MDRAITSFYLNKLVLPYRISMWDQQEVEYSGLVPSVFFILHRLSSSQPEPLWLFLITPSARETRCRNFQPLLIQISVFWPLWVWAVILSWFLKLLLEFRIQTPLFSRSSNQVILVWYDFELRFYCFFSSLHCWLQCHKKLCPSNYYGSTFFNSDRKHWEGF